MQNSNSLRRLVFPFMLFAALPLWPQTLPGASQPEEIFSFIGMRLEDLVMRLGIPQSVRASRGEEIWQDDVVFEYSEGEFFIYGDRVWQIGLRSAYGIRIGDARAVALLVFGDSALNRGNYILYPLPHGLWPLAMRISIENERVSGIFVFRQDF